MKFNPVLALAATAICSSPVLVDSFVPRSLDHCWSERTSELGVTTASHPEILSSDRRRKATLSKRKLQVEQLERQYNSPPAIPPTTAPVAPSLGISKSTRRRERHDLFSQEEEQTLSAPSVGSSPGLSRDEEVRYAFQIRKFRAAIRLREQLMADKGTDSGVPSEVAWAKACNLSVASLRRILREGQQARGAVVAANVGLVTSIAKRHYASLKQSTASDGGVGTILTIQDMIQEGTLGLMEAAERFEPEKGFRFSTYATWWIRQRILRSVLDSSRIIRLPAHVHGMLQKMRKARAEMKSQLGREPTAPELALHLDVSEEKIQMYEESSRNVISLERPLRAASFKDDRRTIGDTLASDSPTPEEHMEADYLRRDIRAVMDTALADREREVIAIRFGLEDGKPRSVTETAEFLGISQDRVRLVEARAMNKLRHPQRNYKLKEYIIREDSGHDNDNGRKGFSRATSDRRHDTGKIQDPSRIWFF